MLDESGDREVENALTWSACSKNNVSDLHHTHRSRVSDLNAHMRFMDVLILGSGDHYLGPSFAHHSCSRWNSKCISDDVGAGVDEDDLATGILWINDSVTNPCS
jgi:hypothetical protein